ncbi:asparagine synthase-related protein [Sphingomonas sp. UYP23]
MRNPTAIAFKAQSGMDDRVQVIVQAAERCLGATERRQGQPCPELSRTMSTNDPVLAICTGALSMRVFGRLHCRDPRRIEEKVKGCLSVVEAARLLVDQAWGSYVAFLADPDGLYALRDPSGAVPLFVARTGDVQMASTRITQAFLKAVGLDWRVDLDAVGRLLASPAAPAYLSGLVDVEIVVPGQLVAIAQEPVSHTIWHPAEFARGSKALAPETLAAAVDDVIGTLAGSGRVGVELSGGLDSSIVFSSLAHLGHQPKPFNFATAGKGGDEAHFAEDVANRWNIPLYRCASASALPEYRALEGLEHGVQPTVHGLDSVFAQARQDLVDRERVDMIMTGQGGDSLFFNIPTRLVAADRRRDLGIGSLLAASTLDDARRVKGSIWSVLAAAFGRRIADDQGDGNWLTPHLLGPAAAGFLGDLPPVHPWLQACSELSPAKMLHLTVLTHCQIFHGERLFAPTVPMVHPLLAQPLVELALACPTYVLQAGSRDRALARETFRERLPQSVLLRRNKGEASDHYARAILSNRDWLRSYLLDGRLVKAGLLNSVAVEKSMAPDAIRLGTDYRAFLQYASMESWLRHWS